MAEKILKSKEILRLVVNSNNVNFHLDKVEFIVDPSVHAEMPSFMDFLQKLSVTMEINLFELNPVVVAELPRCMELLKRLDAMYNYLVTIGMYGSALEHVFIELYVCNIMFRFDGVYRDVQSLIKISKLLYTLECYRNALYYCSEFNLDQVEFTVIKELCEEKLGEKYTCKCNPLVAPHLDGNWRDKLRVVDVFIQNNPNRSEAYLQRANKLLELEKKIEERFVENCRRRFNQTHFSSDQIDATSSTCKSVTSQNDNFLAYFAKSLVDSANKFKAEGAEQRLNTSRCDQNKISNSTGLNTRKKKSRKGGKNAQAKRSEIFFKKKMMSEEYQTTTANLVESSSENKEESFFSASSGNVDNIMSTSSKKKLQQNSKAESNQSEKPKAAPLLHVEKEHVKYRNSTSEDKTANGESTEVPTRLCTVKKTTTAPLVTKKELSPVKLKIDMSLVSSAWRYFDFFVGCSKCPGESNIQSHVCTGNLLFCRRKTDLWTPLQLLRSKPKKLFTEIRQFVKCEHYPDCPRQSSCTFAHSDCEQMLWTKESQERSKLIPEESQKKLLRESIIVDTTDKHELHMVGKVVSYVACHLCSVLVSPPYFVAYWIEHECGRNIFLVKKDSEAKLKFWTRVRPAPICSAFDMCRNICNCNRTDSCLFAHSQLELTFWKLERESKFFIKTYLKEEVEIERPTANSRRGGVSSIDTRRETVLPSFAAVLVKKKKVVPDNRQLAKNTLPYFICNMCYKDYQRISYEKAGTHFCDGVGKHDWESSKLLVVFDDNGKFERLRPVPEHLRQKFAVRSVPLSLCQKGSSCNPYFCTFPHSDAELKCWTMLLLNKLEPEDVAQTCRYVKEQVAAKSTLAATAAPTTKKGSVWKTGPNDQPFGISMLQLEQSSVQFYCFLCNKEFRSHSTYEDHVRSETHQILLCADQKKSWVFEPPRSAPPFTLCTKKLNKENCQCSNAHSAEEIAEWIERCEFIRSESGHKREENELNVFLDQIGQAKGRSDVVVNSLPSIADVNFLDGGNSVVRLNSDLKGNPHRWTISVLLTTQEHVLRNVILTDKRFFYYFRILSPDSSKIVSPGINFAHPDDELYYEIRIEFIGSNCLGTFTQEVLLDFGISKFIGINLTVHLGLTETTITRMAHLEQLLTSDVCWDEDNCEIMWISKERFNVRPPSTEIVAGLDFELNESNYFTNMKKWIQAEELHRQKILSSFRLSSTAELDPFLVGDHEQIIRPPVEGCLFAKVYLDAPLSEDFDVYDLLSGYCQYAFVAMKETDQIRPAGVKRRVYEANVVGSQNFGFDGLNQEHVILCLSQSFVNRCKLRIGQRIQLEVQFNINHKNFVDWLKAMEMMRRKELTHCLFPNLVKLFREYLLGIIHKNAYSLFPKLYTLEEKWKKSDMNSQQCKVLLHVAICAVNKEFPIPPFVIFGPFGTGKTRTMAEAVALLLAEFPASRILICTHSNTTADLYISLLEKYTQFPTDKLRRLLFRIFAKKRTKFENALPFIKPYIRMTSAGILEEVSIETLKSVQVVLCTLSMTYQLIKIFEANPDCQMFTHIFLDEAAQGLEAEVLMPLCMSTKKTCVVVAGDHYQIKPTIYLKESAELGCSYLERLYYAYDNQLASFDDTLKKNGTIPQLLFNENYRCHPEILEFISAEFYGDKSSLKSCCPILESSLKPMYFSSAFGVEETIGGGVSLSNQAEAQEVLDQIQYFWDNWPPSWGDKDIGVIVPYFDQYKVIKEKVRAIRRYAGKVNIGKVHGAQGKEFKVLILSIVRGQNILKDSQLENRNLGFLDDGRLINTALTRARYCVVVVGDPIVAYNVGGCKKIWQRYIEYCIERNTFLPSTFTLDEMKRESEDLIRIFGLSEKRMKETKIDVDAIIRQLVRKSKPVNDSFVFPQDQNQEDTPLDEAEIENFLKETLKVDIEPEEKPSLKSSVFDESQEVVECTLHISSSNVIYGTPTDRKREVIYIRGRKHCLMAFHEDIVAIRESDRNSVDGKLYGFVVELIERRFEPEGKKFVCLADPHTVGVLTPLDPRIPRIVTLKRERKGEKVLIEYDVDERSFITFKAMHQLNSNNFRDKLYVVMFLKWTEGYFCPLGVIVDTIPQRKTLECGAKVLEINFDIERQFTGGVFMEMRKIEKQFSSAATKEVRRLPDAYRSGREDLTKNLVCFTIDSPEAVDLDDALSMQPGKDADTHIVGVHIVDVTAFVEKESDLDKEAYRRGVTLYSCEANRTAHMFPQKLSSILLSLLPNGEKATISVFFEINEKSGEIESVRYARSIIVNRHRMTYPQVEDILREKINSKKEEELHKKLKILHLLAKKQKSLRLGLAESLSVDYDVQQYYMAELLVSEWMIIANKYVAEKICKIFPSLCVLRRQLSPPTQMLQQWVEKFKTRAKNSLLFQKIVVESKAKEEDELFLLPDNESSLPDVQILTSTLDEIFEAKKNRDYATLQVLVCTEKVHPWIVPLSVEMAKMQEKGFYQTSGVAGEDTTHYGLNLKLYTHFTSPLRRYPDMVTHRLLTAALDDSVLCSPYEEETLNEICRHCTEKSWRATDYEREEFGLKFAVEISKTPVEVMAVVSNVGEVELSLEFPTLDKNVRHLKSLRFNHLQLRKNPKVDECGQVTLFWKKEIYPIKRVNVEKAKSHVVDGVVQVESDMYVTRFRGVHWFRLLEALKSGDSADIDRKVDDLSRFREEKQAKDVCSDLYLKKNKNYEQKLKASFVVKWSSSTALKFQLSSEIHRGCLTPCLQLLRLTPSVNLCLEHVRDSCACFNGDVQRQATKTRYQSVEEYQNIWLPLLQLEAAHASVTGDAIRIHGVDGIWNHDDKNKLYKLKLTFPFGFCQRRQIKFSRTDCDSVPIFLRSLIKLDYFCVEVPVKHENGEYIFLAHCASTSVAEEENFFGDAQFVDEFSMKDKVITVSCVLTYCSTEFPQHLLGQSVVCNVEFLQTPDAHHRMQNALLDLERANPLVEKIILNKNSKFSFLPIDRLIKHSQLHEFIKKVDCTLSLPNEDQIKAIVHSLTSEFSLIWGPPGTGKTVTAVRLACCIAKLNKLAKTGSSKLVYCAPSNKAVNVVGRKFVNNVREKDLHVVRMYGREIERSKYPLPNGEPPRPSAAQEIDTELESIALHELVRNNTSYGHEIVELDDQFRLIRESIKKGEEVKVNLMQMAKTHVALIRKAEKEVFLNCDIILCTCSASSKDRLHFLDDDNRVRQLLIDEASMCTEPESLIPIMSTRCEQVTLVGDHKQLGPVVLSQEAREFGFDSSLFQRYAKHANMLTKHYRMHEEIARFPSQCFYDDQLQAATHMQFQPSGLDIWPKGKMSPLVFCNCVGDEKQSVVSTDDSSEMSASNEIEAQHVIRMIRQLIEVYDIDPTKIAILSQYRAQISLILSLLPKAYQNKVRVLTVITSQGDEWDYVFFTTVRSCPEVAVDRTPAISWIRRHLGSVTDERQINVAITRSKQGVVVIGNRSLLSVDKTWKQLTHSYKERGLIVEAEYFLTH